MRPRNNEIYYCEPVYRPPSEAYSLLIQATEGCTFRCSFCVSNLTKQFKIRSFEEICRDLDIAADLYGKSVNRIFLLDGNAFVMDSKLLIEICDYAKKKFPNLERVGAYAHAKDILRKSIGELKQIAASGLKIVYLGIETGDNDLLKAIGKHISDQDLINAAQMLHEADITLSGTIILGLAGNDKKASEKHAIATANVINKICPSSAKKWYISALTLMIPPGTQLYEHYRANQFVPMNSTEVLQELRQIIDHVSDDLHSCVFRSNHASNYLPIKGVLAQDKQKILKQIDIAIQNPDHLRPEYFRGL